MKIKNTLLFLLLMNIINKISIISIKLNKNLILETNSSFSKYDIIKNAKKWKIMETKTTAHFFIKNWEKKHISEVFY